MISSMTVSHASIPLVLLDEFVPSAITAHEEVVACSGVIRN